MSKRDQRNDEAWILETVDRGAAALALRSRASWQAMTEERRTAHLEDLVRTETALADAMRHGIAPGDDTLAPLLERHRAWIGTSWGTPPTPEAYAGLADVYEAHRGFVARFEAIMPGFTNFLAAALRAHAGRMVALE